MAHLNRLPVLAATAALLWSCAVPPAAAGQPGPPAGAPDSTAPRAPATSYSTVPDDFSLTISPTRLAIGPADVGKAHEITVVNRGRLPVRVDVEERDFTGGVDGALLFQEQAPYSASRWLTVEPTALDVPPGQSAAVRLTVALPAAPEPGDHQVAVVFLVKAGVTGANVLVNRGVATPVYVTVPGPVDDHTTVSDLSVPGFTLGGATPISVRVHDHGTVHRDFRGRSALTVDAAGSPRPFPDFTVLRGGTRVVATTWDPPLLCVCHPSITVANDNGQTSTVTARVVVLPLHLIGAVVAVLVLAWLAWRLGRRRYRAAVAAAAAAHADEPPTGP
jgi:hypothetical protein